MQKKFDAKTKTLLNVVKKGLADLSYQDFLEGTRSILQKSQDEPVPYTVLVAGREYIVNKNVFSPKYFNDTELFALNLPIQAGDEVLEIGPGTGAVSITMLYRGAAKVVAIDINPDAVQNTQENIQKHGIGERMEVRRGDLYGALKDGEKFDAIFWNTPFGFVTEPELTDLEKSVWDIGYKATECFIKEAYLHLKPGGRLYLGFSSTMGNMELLTKIAAEAGYRLKTIYEAESIEVHPVKFEIFEAIA
jgi:methylase of polypeptide subunit release factors